jgi:hypothetical protein
VAAVAKGEQPSATNNGPARQREIHKTRVDGEKKQERETLANLKPQRTEHHAACNKAAARINGDQ